MVGEVVRRLDPPIKELLNAALRLRCRTYHFNRSANGVVIQDISTLDPDSQDDNISGWGGLSGFSGAIADEVGTALAEGGIV